MIDDHSYYPMKIHTYPYYIPLLLGLAPLNQPKLSFCLNRSCLLGVVRCICIQGRVVGKGCLGADPSKIGIKYDQNTHITMITKVYMD